MIGINQISENRVGRAPASGTPPWPGGDPPPDDPPWPPVAWPPAWPPAPWPAPCWPGVPPVLPLTPVLAPPLRGPVAAAFLRRPARSGRLRPT
ncbi:hypothetical protein FE263_07530 [Lichenicoccus roseus]|uniref:Uncharacterized protein n=1 Tax=Lichenicoccus roseus TaxID=2683649 RepID=A0A5R9J6M2_9PROT|nr:hypothetical protein FE263_07530 [Lichenicoccus roseus]